MKKNKSISTARDICSSKNWPQIFCSKNILYFSKGRDFLCSNFFMPFEILYLISVIFTNKKICLERLNSMVNTQTWWLKWQQINSLLLGTKHMGVDSCSRQFLQINSFGKKNHMRKKLKFGRKTCKLTLFFLMQLQWMTLLVTQLPFICGLHLCCCYFTILCYFPSLCPIIFCYLYLVADIRFGNSSAINTLRRQILLLSTLNS